MRLLVIGCGRMGSAAAEDLTRTLSDADVVVADLNPAAARQIAEKIWRANVSWMKLDAAKRSELVETLKGFDLALGFLPPKFGFRLMEACIQAG
ncbi:MAG: saccharopine dehydrogenase NADP-binding domain-containing protein [Candidatus Bathyarchaeia archaeon]